MRKYRIIVQHIDKPTSLQRATRVLSSDAYTVDPPASVDDITDMFGDAANWIESIEMDARMEEMQVRLARVVGTLGFHGVSSIAALDPADVDYDYLDADIDSDNPPQARMEFDTPDGQAVVTVTLHSLKEI